MRLGILLILLFAILTSVACGGDTPTKKAPSAAATQAPATQPAAATNTPPIPAPTSTLAPPTNTPPRPGVAINFVSSPIRPGQTATLRATTQPGAACSISYTTPAGTVSQAQGLVAKNADPSGNVSWSWVIGTNTNPGTGTVRVTCNGQTATTPIVISA